MAKYRARARVVEAEQWFRGQQVEGVCTKEDVNHLTYRGGPWQPHIHYVQQHMYEDGYGRKKMVEDHLFHAVQNGDWILTDETGRRWPLTAEQFEASWELVEDGATCW